jgi:hypothetical protein
MTESAPRFWSAATCRRFPTGRHVCQFQSAVVPARSKFRLCFRILEFDTRDINATRGGNEGTMETELKNIRAYARLSRQPHQHGFATADHPASRLATARATGASRANLCANPIGPFRSLSDSRHGWGVLSPGIWAGKRANPSKMRMNSHCRK